MHWITHRLYMADLMVRMAHHSTAIEGNTLTLGDSRSILIDGIVPAKAVRLREVYEVANYAALMPFLEEHYREPLDLSVIQGIHRILLRAIDRGAGEFKTAENMIVGASFLPTHPAEVRPALLQWCGNLAWQLEHAASEAEKVAILMDFHIRFERIHPFSDGNGRTGRALIVLSCAREQLVPIVIEKEQRNEYITLLNDGDTEGLTRLARQLQEKERIRMDHALRCEYK